MGAVRRSSTLSDLSDGGAAALTEELVAGAFYSVTVAGSYSLPVFVAPFACTITAASVAVWQIGFALSETDYWTVTLRRFRGGSSVNIASKATSGEAITQRADWNFDAVAFSNNTLLKGDCVDFAFVPTGSPASFDRPFCQIRYEPT